MSNTWYVHWREFNKHTQKNETHSRPFSSSKEAQDKAKELRSKGNVSSVRVQNP